MDWEWSRQSATDPDALDWFIIRVRRSDRAGDDRKALTFIDRTHGEEPDETRTIFPNLDAVFEITGPLHKELRADGWTLIRTRHKSEVIEHTQERATV
jgi:hypothetical protein